MTLTSGNFGKIHPLNPPVWGTLPVRRPQNWGLGGGSGLTSVPFGYGAILRGLLGISRNP